MTSTHEERPGHHWHDPERVTRYIERIDRRREERGAVFSLMAALMPFSPDADILVLDLGTGYGPLAAALLEVFPKGRVIGLDMSEPMIAAGRERMAAYGDRFRYIEGDFGDGALPPLAVAQGPYDAVVSSLAIHHLPPAGVRSLYRCIYENLLQGGCFFNIDYVHTDDDFLRATFQRIRDQEDRALGLTPEVYQSNEAAGTRHHSTVPTLDDHVNALRDAGFQSVDCFWKRLTTAMVGGYKR